MVAVSSKRTAVAKKKKVARVHLKRKTVGSAFSPNDLTILRHARLQLLKPRRLVERGETRRRYLVPRQWWANRLPNHMWYNSVQKCAPPVSPWEFTRERAWRGAIQLPPLSKDPLFLDPDEPALIRFSPQRNVNVRGQQSRGAVIIVPGGNYEFLCPYEGQCVASWLARKGIPAYVLRYRLMPRYGIEEALEDLQDAVKQVRKDIGSGPICLMGFSAGGHLCASFSAAGLGRRFRRRAGLTGESSNLCQVLVYPCLNGSIWMDPNEAGWWYWNWKECTDRKRGDELAIYDLVNHKPVAEAAPVGGTFLVHSTEDLICGIEDSDLYARRVRRFLKSAAGRGHESLSANQFVYVRGPFGDHGTGVTPVWGPKCVDWLRSQGFRF